MSGFRRMPEKKLLEWSPRSQYLVERIRAYIEPENPKAAQDVIDEIAITAAGLRTFPLLGKPWKRESRKLVLPKYPYVIIYKLTPSKVLILAVSHQSKKNT